MIKTKTVVPSDNTIAAVRAPKISAVNSDPKMAENFKLMTQDTGTMRERINQGILHRESSEPSLTAFADDTQLLYNSKVQGGVELKLETPRDQAGGVSKNIGKSKDGSTPHKDYLNRFSFDQLNNDILNTSTSNTGTKRTGVMLLKPEVLQHVHAEELLDLNGNLSTSKRIQDALELKILNGGEGEVLTAVKALGGELGGEQYLSRFKGHDLLNMSGTLTQNLRNSPMAPSYLGYTNVFQANQLEGGHYARFAQNSYSEQKRISVSGSTYEPVYRSKDNKVTVYFSEEKKEAVIAYRGTDSSDWGDVLRDAQAKDSTFLEGFDVDTELKAQTSFYERYLNQKEGINSLLNAINDLDKITYTGHGVGAATAQIAGLLAGIENDASGSEKNIYIEAYNSPNVGNKQLQTLYRTAKRNNIISSNVYNSYKDPVSAVPTSAVQLDSNITTRSVENANNVIDAKGRHFHDLRLWNMSKGALSVDQIDKVHSAARASYDNVDNAAIAMLTIVNPISIDQNLEWGGLFYELNNKVHSTLPIQGTENSVVTESRMHQVPNNATLIGNWHTHGDWTDVKNNPVKNSEEDVYNSGTFSNQDIVSFNSFRTNVSGDFRYGYLGTPGGELKKFDLDIQEAEKIWSI